MSFYDEQFFQREVKPTVAHHVLIFDETLPQSGAWDLLVQSIKASILITLTSGYEGRRVITLLQTQKCNEQVQFQPILTTTDLCYQVIESLEKFGGSDVSFSGQEDWDWDQIASLVTGMFGPPKITVFTSQSPKFNPEMITVVRIKTSKSILSTFEESQPTTGDAIDLFPIPSEVEALVKSLFNDWLTHKLSLQINFPTSVFAIQTFSLQCEAQSRLVNMHNFPPGNSKFWCHLAIVNQACFCRVTIWSRSWQD